MADPQIKYRKPTESEAATLEEARRRMRQGLEDEKSFPAKILPTFAKSARDDIRSGMKLRESVPASARTYDEFQQSEFKKGGKVASASKRADGCCQRGKTRGKLV